jgi:hypothetical protein
MGFSVGPPRSAVESRVRSQPCARRVGCRSRTEGDEGTRVPAVIAVIVGVVTDRCPATHMNRSEGFDAHAATSEVRGGARAIVAGTA